MSLKNELLDKLEENLRQSQFRESDWKQKSIDIQFKADKIDSK